MNDAAFDNAQYDIPPAVRFNEDGRWRAVRRLRYLTHVRIFDTEELLVGMKDLVIERVAADVYAFDMDGYSFQVSIEDRRARCEALVARFLNLEDSCDWHTGRADIRRRILEMHVEWIMEHEFTDQGR